ncbi:MAG: nucleotide sugar dehydrogenase [bacterium]
MTLRKKIDEGNALIGVVGLGYVGLPLSVMCASKGFRVTGIDVSTAKIASINRGESYISDVAGRHLKSVVEKGRLTATADFEALGAVDIVFICVPTPFTATKDPDISHIVRASEEIRKRLRRGQLIVLKSTTYPETTEKVILPILESTGLKVGRDFYLAFSPERIDPGNKRFTISNTPVVVGGVTKRCTSLTSLVHRKIGLRTIPVSSPRVAEMEKLLENVFRSVNIALVNELACLCDRMRNIDIWEVIDAATTKPFGFMPFYPGPGIGGHCINVDPYFLSWKAKEYDFHTNFIELAAETNENMPYYIFALVLRGLNRAGVALLRAKILILGVAFKKDVNDIRNSPALKIMEIFLENGLSPEQIVYNDPFVPRVCVGSIEFRSQKLLKKLVAGVDCVLITTDHSQYDYEWLVKEARLVVDTRNATGRISDPRGKIVKLGASL